MVVLSVNIEVCEMALDVAGDEKEGSEDGVECCGG